MVSHKEGNMNFCMYYPATGLQNHEEFWAKVIKLTSLLTDYLSYKPQSLMLHRSSSGL